MFAPAGSHVTNYVTVTAAPTFVYVTVMILWFWPPDRKLNKKLAWPPCCYFYSTNTSP